MRWQDKYRAKLITAEQAAALVKPGDVVAFPLQLHPRAIAMALAERREELHDVTLVGEWSEDHPWLQPGWGKTFIIKDVYGTRYTRQGLRERWIDWVPWPFSFSSDISRQGQTGRSGACHGADFFMFRVTPPNEDGYCSFGHSLFYTPSAVKSAKTAIALVDPSLIWTCGDYVHVSELDYLVEPVLKESIQLSQYVPIPSKEEQGLADVIAAHIASLIHDGDTIQVGIGTSSEAIWQFLGDKNDLGLDTEILVPETVELIKKGVFTGKRKNVNKEKVVCSALMTWPHPSTPPALQFVDNNQMFEFCDISYIANVPRVASNDNMVAINAVIAVDLIGQAVIDSIGSVPLSGPGGQPEYLIGSHYSRGGRSISTLNTTAKGGTVSRIVPQLDKGAMVAIPSFYMDYLVTEYGVVNLENKSRRERAEAIISVAHPDFQSELRKAAKKLFWP
ncbi:putative butyrate:acetyl-CoA coenzyme A-transferase [subsurface metagenome]